MRFFWSVLLLTLTLLLTAVKAQQPAARSLALDIDFLIDSTRPYVYLELDHVGPRKPLRDDEPTMGLWLRLKNNCRLPIVIMAFRPMPVNGEALGVVDEVVREPQGIGGGDRGGGGLLAQRGLEGMTDIFTFPNRTEEEIIAAEAMQRRAQEGYSKQGPKRPHGYNSGYEPMSPTITEIAPGRQLLFSLPVNHVSESWHIEIPFRLALPNKSGIRPPYSYVAFYNEDLKDTHGTPQVSPPAH